VANRLHDFEFVFEPEDKLLVKLTHDFEGVELVVFEAPADLDNGGATLPKLRHMVFHDEIGLKGIVRVASFGITRVQRSVLA